MKKYQNDRRRPPGALLLVFGLALQGCLPVSVDVDANGFTTLQIKGEASVQGTVTREIHWQGAVMPEGTPVIVGETVLARDPQKKPPGYTVAGLYDPAGDTETFMLPDGAIDIYYLVYKMPDRQLRMLVPREHFKRAPETP